MKKIQIALDKINHFDKIVCDYVSGKLDKQFYEYDYSVETFLKVINDRKFTNEKRKVLVDVLQKQYAEIFASKNTYDDAVVKNIELLGNEKTFTVTTGHQLNLFTGPLYFIYKILTAIKLSAELKSHYKEYNFVPVFWMATEDHDFEEIKSINLFGKKIEWEKSFVVATGRISTDGVSDIITKFEGIIGNDSNLKKEIVALLKECYNKKNLASATRLLAHKLFAKYGMVIIDGDNHELKKQFASVMEDELANQTAHKLVTETNRNMEKNYAVQVKPREINLFYLSESFRDRIVNDEGFFRINNQTISFAKEEMLKILNKAPEVFSPNVLLRPLYQETILPNLAYVGGPAEVHYWLQLKSLFEYHKINFPVVVLRNGLTLIDADAKKKMDKFSFSENDIFKEEDVLIKEYLQHEFASEFSLEHLLQKTDEVFDEIMQRSISIDSTLKASVDAERHKTHASIKLLESKLLKAQKQKSEVAVNQIKKLKEKLFPDRALQERSENIFQYISKFGFEFIDKLYNEMEALPKEFLVLNTEK